MPKGETSVADRDADGIPDRTDAEEPAKPRRARRPDPSAAAGRARADAARPRAAAAHEEGDGHARWANRQHGPRRGAEGYVQPSQPRNVHSLAAVAVQGGTTRYDIPDGHHGPRQERDDGHAPRQARPRRGHLPLRARRRRPRLDVAPVPRRALRERAPAACSSAGPSRSSSRGRSSARGCSIRCPPRGWATVPFALERAIGVDSHAEDRRAGHAHLEDRERRTCGSSTTRCSRRPTRSRTAASWRPSSS